MATTPLFNAGATSFASRPVSTSIAPVQVSQASSPVAMPQCNLIWKENFDAVLNHPASPNEILYFGSTGDENVMWVRETDANGQIKNPIHRLDYSISEIPFGPEAQFVTKEEHQQLYDLVAEVSKKLDKLDEMFK